MRTGEFCSVGLFMPLMRILIPVCCLTMFLFQSCDLPLDPGPQPNTIIQTEFVPGLNIFGILRLEENSGQSYIRVERAYLTSEENEEFNPLIRNALVLVASCIDSEPADTFFFATDSVLGDVYLNPSFSPAPGTCYHLSVFAPDLPTAESETSVPSIPSVAGNSIQIEENLLTFQLLSQPDIKLYDIFVLTDEFTLEKRLLNTGSVQNQIEFQLPAEEWENLSVEVFGYDTNLTEYVTDSFSFKPQSYHETVTSIENGYGCFGSVSKVVFQDIGP